MTDAERIIQYIEDTEYDREVLPHYGLLPDWFVRYNELKELIVTYLNGFEESEDIDQRTLKDSHKGIINPES